MNIRDSVSFKSRSRFSAPRREDNLTQNEIKIESEKASERDNQKVQTFGKEQPTQLKDYLKPNGADSRNSSIELNVTAPLEDKSLEAVINDSSVHKYEKL